MLESAPPTIILLIATFCAIILISFTVLACAICKSKSQPDYPEDLQVYEEQLKGRRETFTFVYNPGSGGGGRVGVYTSPSSQSGSGFGSKEASGSNPSSHSRSASRSGTTQHNPKPKPKPKRNLWFFGTKRTSIHSSIPESESDSGWTTIHISPSHPAIFGQEERGEEGSVKVVLTPPTPAKERVFRAVLSDLN
ncbi:hypothetical protein NMY22_g14918 [Coprinellus aureogranulatus]|nr:hypothetical protein NMY22_g14918 [Coprinellus aureogranulatus]